MISVASSIKFRKYDGLLASFDNTQFNEADYRGRYPHHYRQKVYSTDTDTVTIQVKVANGYTIDLYYSLNCYGPWTKLSSGTKEVDGTAYDFWEVTIDFSAFAASTVQFKLMIYNTAPALYQTWYSEPVEILTATDDDLLQVEFWNTDNAFEVDYTTGITHLLRVESSLTDYKAAGESSVFDNQEEVTRIRGEVKRVLVFRTEPIPAYLAEMLHVAVKEDKFFINEVEFIAETEPEIEQVGALTVFSCALTQRSVIGLNTHDIGYDCDTSTNEDMMHLREDDAAGPITFTVPAGYIIAYITGYRTAGSPLVKAGTTVGGNDVLFGMNLNATTNIWETAHLGVEIAPVADATLYVDVSGVGATADIDILLIYNRNE